MLREAPNEDFTILVKENFTILVKENFTMGWIKSLRVLHILN